MWVDSTAGVQFSVIASVDDGADTVTVDVAYSQTEGSRNWGIGGKRSTLEGSAAIYADPLPGWEIDIEETGTNYLITTRPSISCDGDETTGKIVFNSSSSTRPTIAFEPSGTGNLCLSIPGTFIRFEHLKFDQTNNQSNVQGMFGSTIGNAMIGVHFKDCEITQESSTQKGHCIRRNLNGADVKFTMEDCYVHDVGGVFLGSVQGRSGVKILRNHFKAMAAGSTSNNAIHIDDNYSIVIKDNIIADANARGIEIKDVSGGAIITGNVIYNSGTDGVGINGSGSNGAVIERNIIVNSGQHGIQVDHSPPDDAIQNDWNAFANNTSGSITGIALGDNDIELGSVDPFVDAGNDDYNLDATASEGQTLRDTTLILPS